MIISQLNRTEMRGIDSNKSTLNRLTMMLCDCSELIELNQIVSHRFEQADVESIDHDALQR